MQNSQIVSKSKLDDFVEYSIYPLDWNFSKEELKRQLIDLKAQCLASISHFNIEYIWHQSPFSLIVKEDHLYGRIEISDNVEDEWYAISLLFKLSKLYSNIAISVQDQDGEVLLIEAADNLPAWAQDPEACNNRVYIYKNEVHLIPVAQNPSQLTPIPSGVPSVEDAVNTVYRYPDLTRAPTAIQNVIKERLKSYPEIWKEQQQFLYVIVPEKVKNLLHILPKYLISASIRCFCNRDVLDIRKCRVMREFPAKDLVKTGLILSKCLYAMLTKQEFIPDKKLNWQVPGASDANYKAAVLGFKLTCGLEILLSQYQKTNRSQNLDSALDEAKYQQFENSLYAIGYFQNELKGSKNWLALSMRAKEYFLSSLGSEDNCLDQLYEENYSAQLHRIVRKEDHEDSDGKVNKYLIDEDLSKKADDDSWLNFEQSSFDEMLKVHFNINETSLPANKIKNEKSIPSELKNFLSCISNFEGVDTLPKDNLIDENKVTFDAKQFENVVKRMSKFSDNDYISDNADSELNDEVELDKEFKIKDAEWQSYSEQMKHELHDTKVMKICDNELIESLDDIDKPVDLDMGVFQNILQSYNNENGMPGPASTLLNSLGLNIEPES